MKGKRKVEIRLDMQTFRLTRPRTLWETAKMVGKNPLNFAKIGAYALGY
jgi:hypothetical protein